MTEKIIKFPDKAASISRDLEKYYDKVGYLDEEGKEYAKKIIREIVERYDGWGYKYEIDYPQNLKIEDRGLFLKQQKEVGKQIEREVNKQISKLFSQLVGEITALEIKIYRLQKGLF